MTTAPALAWILIAAPQEPVTLEVLAGEHLRRDVPLEWELPAELARADGLRLVHLIGEREVDVPVQRVPADPPRVSWILDGELEPGSLRRYRLSAGPERRDSGGVEVIDDGASLTLRHEGRNVLRYAYGLVSPPEGVDEVYARSGYLHPVWSPEGRVVTGDFPPAHRHHHGIWFPWTRTVFQLRKVDFWNSAAKQGRVEVTAIDDFGGGPVFGGFRSRLQHVDLTLADGPVIALEETWDVRAYALGRRRLFDLTSVQRCSGESPLQILEYHYGGLGFRGPVEWEGESATFLTSEGKGRLDGHATRARWCAISGPVDGETTTITILCSPENFRAPQNMRLHPSEPFFCYAPGQLGPFEIRPDAPLTSRYRFVVEDGPPDPRELDRLWQDYAHPPLVRMGPR